MRARHLTPLVAGLATTALAVGAAAAPAATAPASPTASPVAAGEAGPATGVLEEYAADTWRSFDAMVVDRTGLPADNVGGNLKPGTRSSFTSPTNIGAYLWSTVAARDTGLIGAKDARKRMARTIETVGRLEKHEPSGQFYNWYDPKTLEKLRTWPETGDEVQPFMSSVDNGWLATGLLLAARAEPRVAAEADAIREDMDFGCYYNEAEGEGGQIRGGFWDEDFGDPVRVKGDYCGMGEDVWYTGHHYGAFNTEPRMASYLGIAEGQIPPKHYFGTFRTFPATDNCDWAWTEAPPTGEWRTYTAGGESVDVYEGALDYRGTKVVPTWGGSMFEALMVPLFVPEETWGARSWGVNHPLYVQGQIEHGLEETDYGYWGFSPSNNPAGGYREYGVDALGLDGAGYTSDQERTDWDQPWEGCRDGEPAPTAADYGDGVVTPHASFLALRYAPEAALENLANLREDFDAYGKGGFYDAVAVESGQVSKRYLSLDQGMVMAALGNALAGDDMRDYVTPGGLTEQVRPLMEQEVFGASPR